MAIVENEQFDLNAGWQSEAVAASYDDQRFSSLTGRIYSEREKAAIAKLLVIAHKNFPIHSVLDIPCGTGRISELLLQKGFTVSCGDVSSEMINVAKAKLDSYRPGIADFSNMDIYNIDRDSDLYDCVTCIRLFQHLTSEDRSKALRELARVSKKYVIVNVMYISLYYGFLRRVRQLLGRYAPSCTSSKEEIKKELEYSSLRLVESIFTQRGFNGNLVLLLEKV